MNMESSGRAVCGWCGCDLGSRPGLSAGQVSHGICHECGEKLLEASDGEEALQQVRDEEKPGVLRHVLPPDHREEVVPGVVPRVLPGVREGEEVEDGGKW